MFNIKSIISIALVLCLLFVPVLTYSQSLEKGQSICYEIQIYVNVLFDSTQTSCLPGGGKDEALSFTIISSEPVLSIESAKKAWLLSVVGTVGKILNDQPTTKVDELWLSDLNQASNRVAYILPLSLVKSLQEKVSSGQINIEEMYQSIEKNLVKKTLPKKSNG